MQKVKPTVTHNEGGSNVEKQSKELTENEVQFVDEIRGIRERAKENESKPIKAEKKGYKIKLTFDELEFIRHCIEGINEFSKRISGDTSGADCVMYNLDGDNELEDIDLGKLDNKIYRQYYDEYGEVMKPEVEVST